VGTNDAKNNRNDSIQRKSGRAYSPTIFRILALVTLLAAILCIVGATSGSSPAKGISSTETKVGVVIYLLSWIGLLIVLFMMFARYSSIEQGEHRLLWAAMTCAPILLIRLAYSMISALGHNSSFNMITGNVTIQLVMVNIEEILITYIMLITGLTLTMRDKAVYGATDAAEAGRHSPGQTEMGQQYATGDYTSTLPTPLTEQKPRRRRLRGGPITMLVGYIINQVNSRRS
jgi:uncharacterized membrane protein